MAATEKESKQLFIPVTITMEGRDIIVFKNPVSNGDFQGTSQAIRSLNRGSHTTVNTKVDDRGYMSMNVTVLPEGSRDKTGKPCNFAENCISGNCPFLHPKGRKRPVIKPCRYGDGCAKRDICKFGHPSDPVLPAGCDPAGDDPAGGDPAGGDHVASK